MLPCTCWVQTRRCSRCTWEGVVGYIPWWVGSPPIPRVYITTMLPGCILPTMLPGWVSLTVCQYPGGYLSPSVSTRVYMPHLCCTWVYMPHLCCTRVGISHRCGYPGWVSLTVVGIPGVYVLPVTVPGCVCAPCYCTRVVSLTGGL